jgi:cell division protein FtsB
VKALLTFLACPLLALADTVTLESGEQLTGDVLARTATNLTLRIDNDSRTISYTRLLAGNEIRAVSLDAPEPKAQRAAHDALRHYRLFPDQELTVASYAAGIAAFEKFLAAHPRGPLAAEVQQRLADWRAEQTHVSDGHVKFRDRWLGPGAKAAAVAAARQQAAEHARQTELAELRRRLTRLEQEHDILVKGLGEAEASLQRSQHALATMRDVVVPICEDRLITVPINGPSAYWQPLEYRRMVVDEEVVTNPQRPAYEARIVFYERQVTTGQQQLADLKGEIARIRDRISDLKAAAPVTAPVAAK